MSRTVPAAMLTALQAPTVEPFYAVEFLFDTAPVRLWTGHGERIVRGETYVGAGSLLNISGLGEVSDLTAKGATITLNGVPGELVSLALQEPYQRRRCRIYFGVVSVPDVVEVFTGSVNTMPIEDSAEAGTITVTVDSKLIETEKASNLRYTSESQKSRYPGDTFFDYTAGLQDKEIVWGRASA